MSEGNVYEAACEVCEAISDAGKVLAIGCQEIIERLEERPSRRDHFAVAIAAELVREERATEMSTLPLRESAVERITSWAWQLADALDRADPQRSALKQAPPPADDDDDTID